MYVAINKIDGRVYGPFESKDDFFAWRSSAALLLSPMDVFGLESVWNFTEVEFRGETVHDVIPPDSTYDRTDFGPGRLESITMDVWLNGDARIAGFGYVACGNGGQHYPEVNTGVIEAEAMFEYRREHDSLYSMAAAIVDEAIGESWVDPCEDIEEEDTPILPSEEYPRMQAAMDAAGEDSHLEAAFEDSVSGGIPVDLLSDD